MLGFVGDVGDLAKLAIAAEGAREAPDGPDALGHELADCLWAVLVLARLHDVDLAAEFRRMTDDLEHADRLHHHPRWADVARCAGMRPRTLAA
jgi:NTP pyrophosphatase (non-canonical NTP hydrolase)